MHQLIIFDKRRLNPLFEKQIIDLDTDAFYLNLTKEQQEFFLDTLKFHTETKYTHKDYVWHGNVQHCPTCNKTRITSCSACGCGYCYTCNHRFSCNSTTLNTQIGFL